MVLRISLSLVTAFALLPAASALTVNKNVPFVASRQGRAGGGNFKKTALGYQNEAASSVDTQLQIPQTPPLLTGLVLNGEYELTNYIPVASSKCELYEAYRKADSARQNPLIVKMSEHTNQIDMEHQIYKFVAERLNQDKKHLFVEIYDKVEPHTSTNGMAAIVMEKGEDNLRFDIGRRGALRGHKLRKAMETVICAVGALHEKGLVWTEIKAENFVILSKNGGTIKGIDLESVVRHGEFMRMYTAEACPPEFPVKHMYKCLPLIRMDYSFDMWGVGMTLFELATGKPFYHEGLTNLEYIKGMLSDPQALMAHRDSKLLSVDPKARKIIKQCLENDPNARSLCHELLEDPYFSSHKQHQAANINEQAAAPLSSYFGCPRPAAPKIIETVQPADTVEQISREQKDYIPIALKRLGLPVSLEAVLEDAMKVCAQHNPHVAKNLLFNLMESRGNQIIPKNSLNSLLDVIKVCAVHDQETADKLLSILEKEIQHRHGSMAL
jgi:hypothetical protein